MNSFKNTNSKKKVASLLDLMQDDREYESIIKNEITMDNIQSEIQKSFAEIKAVRNREIICYVGNVVSQNVKGSKSIDNTDDLPFSEMINSLPSEVNEIDVILVTGGGSPQQVAKFVEKLRYGGRSVTFIIPYIAMSAGTIFALSGDEIIMGQNSYLGPIDPQVPNKDGIFFPAQSLLTLLDDIEVRMAEAEKNKIAPRITDIHLLKHLDHYRLGFAKTSSTFITDMVEDYLVNYKKWRSNPDDKKPVTDEEKKVRAKKIAEKFCNHSTWKAHDKGINRLEAWELCELDITAIESIPGLARALRRFWALLYFIFEKTSVRKIYGSENYFVVKSGAT